MGEFFFVIKMFVFTVFLVVLLQIKIGPHTLEERSIAWIHESALVDSLRNVASGAVKAGGNGFSYLGTLFGAKEAQVEKKKKESFWGFRRSDAYYREQKKNGRYEGGGAQEESSETDGPMGDEID